MRSEQTKNENRWVTEGRNKGATHVLDVCDTFDHSHYPVYVMPEDDLQEVKKKYTYAEMQVIYGTYEIKPLSKKSI